MREAPGRTVRSWIGWPALLLLYRHQEEGARSMPPNLSLFDDVWRSQAIQVGVAPFVLSNAQDLRIGG